MARLFLKHLTIVGLLLCFQQSFAQENTETEDPYADYSYLWENTKEKEKAEKKRLKEEQKRLKAESKAGGKTVPSDDPIEVEPVLVEDVVETDYKPDTDSIETDINDEDLYNSKEDVVKKDKQRKTIKPIGGDFRSGMSQESIDGKGSINGGFTLTLIDDQYYAGMTLSPEFKVWKLRVGMNIPVLYGLDDKQFRTEMFKSGVGVARLIRYIGYGTQKEDQVYVRVGELSNVMLGYGGLMNNYTNSTSFEQRKVGLHLDVNYRGIFGIETLYSDFNASSQNLLAFRPYVRPLIVTDIPILRTLEIGYQTISDKDQTALQANSFANTGVMKGSGFDMGIRLLAIPFINIDLFASYSRLNYASALSSIYDADTLASTSGPEAEKQSVSTGASVGMNFRMHFIKDVFSTDVRIERLQYDNFYVPQFFNAIYELNKDERILSLVSTKKQNGIYGSLQGHVLKKIRLGGSLLIPNEISEESPAFVQVNADLDRLADKISLHGTYLKGGLSNLEDAFKLDERSLAKLRFIYHMNKFLAAGLDYYWAFAKTSDGTYEATKYVSPYFGLSIKL